MKTILASATALSLLAFAGAASAEAPKYSELPKGSLSGPPDISKKPAAVGARESVPGFFVVSQKFNAQMPVQQRYVTIVGDAKTAASVAAGEGFGSDDASGCFSESREQMSDALDEESGPSARALAWDENLMFQANLWPKAKDNPRAGVGALHSERLVESGGNVSLDASDAWIDPATRGARLIAKSSLPLKLVGSVGSAMGGVKVYAARTEHAGKPFIEIVVTRPTKTAPMSRGMGLVAMHQDGNMSQSNGCGHIRVSLPVDTKGGESAVVAVPLTLPTLKSESDEQERNAKDEPKAETKPTPAPVTTPPPSPKKIRFGKRGLVRSVMPSLVPGGVPGAEPKEREIRSREAQVSLSVSQTSKDKEPVIAVSFGWTGRETTQRTFEADDTPTPVE